MARRVAVWLLAMAVAAATPTPHEQLMIELVNRARAAPAAEAARFGIGLDDGRTGAPLGAAARAPLAPDAALLNAARAHGAWMLATGRLSHTGAGGSAPGDRAAAYGYMSAVGENLSFSGRVGVLGLPADLVRAQHEWLFRSPGHRENMLSVQYREIGAAQALGPFSRRGQTLDASIFTVKFGQGAPAQPVLTGVVYVDADGDGFYSPGEGLGDLRVLAIGAGGVFEAVTAPSGGYALALAPGNWLVRVAYGEHLREAAVRIGAHNVKLDAVFAPEGIAPAPRVVRSGMAGAAAAWEILPFD